MISELTDVWKETACRAMDEGRLHYRVTDAQGRSSNGGESEPLPFRAWSAVIKNARIYSSGWHLTTEPHRWDGQRVWLAEGKFPAGQEEDKTCWGQIRILGEVDPHACLDRSALVRCSDNLREADLSEADLSWASLRGADLREANLSWANLYGANLRGSNLYEADLRGADLCEATLRGADLRGANLRGADLCGTRLRGADLRGADLRGADLRGADLRGADLPLGHANDNANGG